MACSASLSLLPAIALEKITNWLYGVELARLYQCGNEALNETLAEEGCKRFVVLCEPPVRPMFPSVVRHFHALEFFSLTCTYSVTIAHVNLSLLPPSLKHLKLDFFSQSNLLRSSPEDLQIMDLWRMFPLLECVELSTPLYWNSSSEVLPRLDKLTTLCLNDVSASHIVRLPRSLTSLTLEMVEDSQDDWSINPLFPPKLSTLKINKMQSAKLLRWLPSSLTNLSLLPSDQLNYYAKKQVSTMAETCHEFGQWWSKRPESLTKLTIPSYGFTIDHFSHLPKNLKCLRLLDGGDIVVQLYQRGEQGEDRIIAPSLTRLDLPTGDASWASHLLSVLPSELRRLSEWITTAVASDDDTKKLPKKLENVPHMNLRHGWARHLPPNLKTIHFSWKSPVDSVLRRMSDAAEEVSVRDEKRRKLNEEHFPATLCSLTLDNTQFLTPSLNRALIRSGFTALEDLNLNAFGEPLLRRLLTSLTNCPLRSLRVGVSLHSGHTFGAGDLLGRLHMLETLDLAVTSLFLNPKAHLEGDEDESDMMTASRDDCDEAVLDKEVIMESLIESSVLQTLPPALTSVSINAYPMPVKMLAHMAHLKKCRSLVLTGIVGDVKDEHLFTLPRSLISLKLGPGRLDSSSLALSPSHGWKCLPPFLTSLCLPAPRTEVVLDDGGVPKAPACLSYLVDLSFDSRSAPADSPRPTSSLLSTNNASSNAMSTSGSMSPPTLFGFPSPVFKFRSSSSGSTSGLPAHSSSSPSTSSPRHKLRFGKQSIFEDEEPRGADSNQEHGIAAGEEDYSD